MEGRPTSVAVAVPFVVLAAMVAWGAPAVAEPPSSPTAPSGARATTQSNETGASADTANRSSPRVVQSDYVVGRYLLPLAVAIATVFALVLTLVIDSGGSDERANTSEPSVG